jgi:hypothetical protein
MRLRSLVRTLFAAALLSCLCARPVPGEEPIPPAAEVVRLVRVVSDPDTEWDARQSAEQALAKLPARVVLPVLVAHMPDQPAGVFYPPADSAAADKDAPPDWQAFYAARRVWTAQTGGDRPATELAELLPDLLRAARTAEARAAVAAKLATAWSNRAEEPLARLFRDSSEPPAVRGRAAEALLAHYPDRYRAEVCGVADAAPMSSQLKQVLFFALTASPAEAARGRQAEPFTVMLGFQLMERSAHEKEAGSAYGIARRLEVYLDQRFRPADPAAPVVYGPDLDSDARYRRETLDNARTWWRDHGAAIERELAKIKPGPT